MPMRYTIDTERGMLFIEAAGETTQAERLEAMQAWISDPRFRPGLKTLADFSQSTNVPTLAELEDIVAFMRRYATAIGHVRIAMVTARAVTFGVARQFGALAPGAFVTVQVFKDRESALAWLAEDSGMASQPQ